MARKDDKEFILSELATVIDADKLLSVLYKFDCRIPEKESRELDTFLKSGKKLFEKILSTGVEKYDSKKRMAFKYLNTENRNFCDYRYQLEYVWRNIRYYQDGTLCLKNGTDEILLSPWEPKSKEVVQKITRAKKNKTTISKNKDANIKRQEKMEARYEMGRKISSPEEFADIILKDNQWRKSYFYAAQWRAYFGLPIPFPEDLKEYDIKFVKHGILLQELQRKYPCPSKKITMPIYEDKITNIWTANAVEGFCGEIGYLIPLPEEYVNSETRIKLIREGFAKQMKNPDFAKRVKELNHYFENILPIIDKAHTGMINALAALNIDHRNEGGKKLIYFLSDKAIQNTMEYLKENTVDYDYTWKEIMLMANPKTADQACISDRICDMVDIDSLINIQDCSARKVMEAWGILPKKESVAA